MSLVEIIVTLSLVHLEDKNTCFKPQSMFIHFHFLIFKRNDEIWNSFTWCHFKHSVLKSWEILRLSSQRTVDGRNPAPPGMYKTWYIMGKTTYQLVQDFFHQQYHSENRFFLVVFWLSTPMNWQSQGSLGHSKKKNSLVWAVPLPLYG